MALRQDPAFTDPTPSMRVQRSDRLVQEFDEPGTGRSNFAAFLLGGVVIAGGMLGFLYYDADVRGDASTRGGTTIMDGQSTSGPTIRLPGPANP